MELDILKQNTTWNDASASINNNFAKVKTALEQGGGGGSAAVDTQMSDTSEKAVQNKVIKKYVDDEVEDAKAYSEEMADNAETAAKQYADDNKVAKVEGKQLSTEDFTTAFKQKLEGLTNYDDADVRSAIEELQNSLDAIVNGDATSAIDSIQEILAFLSTITDTQTLAGIVSDLKQYVDDEVESVSPLYVNIGMAFPNETATGTLQDLEISFSDILSAAEGKRDIWIVVSDGTAYQCLVTYLSENSGGIAIRAYKHEVNGANFSTIAIAFVDGSVPVWHSNHIEFQEKLVSGENIATVNGQSLLEGGNIVIEGGSGGITEEKEVYIGSEEPTDENVKLWIDTDDESGGDTSGGSIEGVLEATIIEDEEVVAAALCELNERVSESATKEELATTLIDVDRKIQETKDVIIDNEEVTAAALVDLDKRMKDILMILGNAGLIS